MEYVGASVGMKYNIGSGTLEGGSTISGVLLSFGIDTSLLVDNCGMALIGPCPVRSGE